MNKRRPPEKPESHTQEILPRTHEILGPKKILAKNVGSGRARLGITQVECAKRTHIPIGRFRRIESGFGNPAIEELIRIAVILDTNIPDLFTARAAK